jgi:hypothetical protein
VLFDWLTRRDPFLVGLTVGAVVAAALAALGVRLEATAAVAVLAAASAARLVSLLAEPPPPAERSLRAHADPNPADMARLSTLDDAFGPD